MEDDHTSIIAYMHKVLSYDVIQVILHSLY